MSRNSKETKYNRRIQNYQLSKIEPPKFPDREDYVENETLSSNTRGNTTITTDSEDPYLNPKYNSQQGSPQNLYFYPNEISTTSTITTNPDDSYLKSNPLSITGIPAKLHKRRNPVQLHKGRNPPLGVTSFNHQRQLTLPSQNPLLNVTVSNYPSICKQQIHINRQVKGKNKRNLGIFENSSSKGSNSGNNSEDLSPVGLRLSNNSNKKINKKK